MKPARILLTTALSLSLAGAAMANTFGSVEPIPNSTSSTRGCSGTSRWKCARPLPGGSCSAASSTR